MVKCGFVGVALLILLPAGAAAQNPVPVSWTSKVYVTVTGTDANGLQKSGGCNGCQDAGAVSTQTITSGDGYVQFTAGQTNTQFYVGLSNGNPGTSGSEIKWSLAFNGGGQAEVRESGGYKSETTFSANAVFRVAVVSGVVQYSKNGTVFYTSTAFPTYPLLVDTSMMSSTAAFSGAMFSPGPPLASEFLCGLKDDTRVLLPANYDNGLWSPPAKGSSSTDSVFNCSVTRLTDGMSQFNGPARHNYSVMSPFNSNSTRILLQTSSNFFVTDLTGAVLTDVATLNIGTNMEPLWSRTNPSLLYYHLNNQIWSYNVSTGERLNLATISAYTNISFGDGEADLSDDGDYVVVVGKDSGYNPQGIFVYRFSTNTQHSAMSIPAGEALDWCDITASHKVLCSWGSTGTARYRGVELYTIEMAFVKQLVPFVGHSDRGVDVDGSDILVMEASGDTSPPTGCGGNGIEKIHVSTGQKTCLMGTFWSDNTHVSINGPHGYALIQSTHTLNPGTASSPLASNWSTIWGAYYNEIQLVKLDGSQVWRFVHHRTRLFSGCYYCQPRAAISPDGKYLVFDSNFNTQPVADYTDVFLIRIK